MNGPGGRSGVGGGGCMCAQSERGGSQWHGRPPESKSTIEWADQYGASVSFCEALQVVYTGGGTYWGWR